MSDDYKIHINKTVNLLRYAPVLDTNNKLISINKLENNIDWGKLIEFNVHLREILPLGEDKYGAAKLFLGYSFVTNNGNQLPKFPMLTYGNMYEDILSNTPLSKYS